MLHMIDYVGLLGPNTLQKTESILSIFYGHSYMKLESCEKRVINK